MFELFRLFIKRRKVSAKKQRESLVFSGLCVFAHKNMKKLKKHLHFYFFYDIIIKQFRFAAVAELADAPDSKSGGSDIVWVRVPPAALKKP